MLHNPAPGYIDNYYSRTLDDDTHHPALQGDVRADVCVIGGGLAGINTALGLVKRGKSVVLIEAKRVGWAASGRNGGFVAKGFAADDSYLIKKLGLEHTRKLTDLAVNARGLIKQRIAEYNIDCGPLTSGVLIVSVKDQEAEIRDTVQKANDNFGHGLEYWSTEKVRDSLKSEKYFQGYLSPNDFQFHPLRYVQGLTAACAAMGVKIHEESEARSIDKEGSGWRVKTASGSVLAKDIVICCSCYSKGLDLKIERSVLPVKSYVMVTKPLPDDVLAASINTPHPVYDMRWACDYYRVLEDRRILWGGRVGLLAEPHNIAKAMIGDMLKAYPQLKGKVEADLAWSCLMCYAPHKMPQIGQMAPGYWYNMGFGGHGLVPTTVGGEVIASAIASKDTRVDLFEPFGMRYAGGALGPYAAQMVYWLWRLRDYIN